MNLSHIVVPDKQDSTKVPVESIDDERSAEEYTQNEDTSIESTRNWLRVKAIAFFIVGGIFTILFAIDFFFLDPIPVVDEVILLLGAALSGYEGKKRFSRDE